MNKAIVLFLTSIILFSCTSYPSNKVEATFLSEDGAVIYRKELCKNDTIGDFPAIERRNEYLISWQDSIGNVYSEETIIKESVVIFPVFIEISSIIDSLNKVCFFGDSIGAGIGWTINTNEFPVKNYKELGFSGGWANLMALKYNMADVIKLSVGEACFSREIDNGSYYYEQLEFLRDKFLGVNFDVLIIETTFNDIDSIVIGKTSVSKTLDDFSCLLTSIKELYPLSKIIVMNSPDCRYQKYEYSQLAQEIKQLLDGYGQICENNSIPYLNFREIIDTSVYKSCFFPDGIHHNEEFYKEYFGEVEYFIAETFYYD